MLRHMLTETTAVTVITVVATRGSAPRKVGTKMIVSSDQQYGTIGGGNLEFSAVNIARDRQLASTTDPFRQKFALGPSLGQCCGGAVELLFEVFDSADSVADNCDGWFCRCIDGDTVGAVPVSVVRRTALSELLAKLPGHQTFSLIESEGEIWACDKLKVDRPTVALFGAGHVGQALVAQLSLLNCRVCWIDERSGMFPDRVSPEFDTIQSDHPADEVDCIPDDAWYIVMTHRHDTDFAICKAILEKQRFSFLGLIGSETKRQTFINRLIRLGFSESCVDRLCCPIGIAGIQSNQPQSIALGVAAQLTMLWESENKTYMQNRP